MEPGTVMLGSSTRQHNGVRRIGALELRGRTFLSFQVIFHCLERLSPLGPASGNREESLSMCAPLLAERGRLVTRKLCVDLPERTLAQIHDVGSYYGFTEPGYRAPRTVYQDEYLLHKTSGGVFDSRNYAVISPLSSIISR